MQELSLKLVEALNASLGVWYLIIINAIGVLAIICKVIEYQIKKTAINKLMASVANFLWVLYFALYGDFASALTCVLTVARIMIFAQRGKRKWASSSIWLYVFIILQIVVAVSTFRVWQDIFSITAGFVGIFAYYVLEQKKYRALSFVYMVLWLLNTISKAYLMGIISDSFSTVSVAIAIYRYDVRKKKDDKFQGN